MKNYKWEVNDGVINFVPIKDRDSRYERLLNLRISSFTVRKTASMRSVRLKLMNLPEIKNFLNSNNLSTSGNRGGILSTTINREVGYELSFSNLTVKELLNKIAKTKGGGWILKKHDYAVAANKEYIDFDI